jgi:hypothetical protein
MYGREFLISSCSKHLRYGEDLFVYQPDRHRLYPPSRIASGKLVNLIRYYIQTYYTKTDLQISFSVVLFPLELHMITQLPETTQRYLLRDAEKRDPVTARRSHLTHILFRERYLTRESLMLRVESLMGFASFGKKSWKDNFYRDMRVVKAAMKRAGLDLKYSRAGDRPGYYIAGEAFLHPDVKKEIAGALDEIDQKQIEFYKHISPAQKFYQACSIINLSKKISMRGNE